MKKRPQKGQPVEQLVRFLTNIELHTDPYFGPLIQEAQMTGDGRRLNYAVQSQMPAIQQYMMQLQLEAQKAEADPFYPRPTLEMFPGNIPIALVPDEFGEPPGGFIMNIGDFMRHMFVCGSPGTGKSRGILSIIKTLKEL